MTGLDRSSSAAYRSAWRADFSNQSLNLLHAEAFHHAVLDYDWLAQVRGHSLGWVCAFDGDTLIGFVNVAWDGDDHKRRALLKGLLNISGSATGARPVELTVVVQSEVRPWRFPRREIA
jgi:hypothetical protein